MRVDGPLDDVLDAVAIVAAPDDVADAIVSRFGNVLDPVSLNPPYAVDPDLWADIAADLRDVGGDDEGG